MMLLPLLLASLYLNPPVFAPWPQAAPPLTDIDRFPAPGVCERQLAFLESRRKWLDGQRCLFADPLYVPWFDAATDDMEARRLPWATLGEAHDCNRHWRRVVDDDGTQRVEEGCDPAQVRLHLAHLRELLGDRDYNAGSMPALIGRAFWCP